jgi:hypothetical protein
MNGRPVDTVNEAWSADQGARSAPLKSRSLKTRPHLRRATRDCEEISMPFALIPTALGVCFCQVWAFIGGMVLHDGQLAAQQDLDSDIGIVRLPTRARRRGAA